MLLKKVSEINHNNRCCVRNGAAVTALCVKITVLGIRHFQFKDEAGSLSEALIHFSMLFNSAVSCYDKITLVTYK